ncbi:gp53-like domain-containing protein [Enterobacter roggenkampii]
MGEAAKLGVATNAQMQAGTATNLLPSVAAVMSLFSKRSFNANDYIRIPDVPGGLVIQWGVAVTASTGVSVTFPFPMASALRCFTTANQTADVNTTFQSLTTTGVFLQAYNQAGALISGTTTNWLAIGVSA